MIPQRYLPYFAMGFIGMILIGLVIAVAASTNTGNNEGGGFLEPKYIAKFYIRVERGTFQAWKVQIASYDYTIDKAMVALDLGKSFSLSFFEGTYKVCARASRGGTFLDEDCTTIKLNPGDKKDVTLSLNLGNKPTATVKLFVYDEDGGLKDEKEVQL